MEPNGRDYATDPVLKRLADSDHAVLILARRSQARGPHTEYFRILGAHDEDDVPRLLPDSSKGDAPTDPITIASALTGAQAYTLGIDLAIPLSAHLLSSPLLAAPAASPQITEIRIVHHSLYSTLPQPIVIMAAPEVGYIRIYDAIVAIHRAMAPTLRSLPGTKFVGLAYDVALSNRILRTQDKYQDRTWILMTHDRFVPVSHSPRAATLDPLEGGPSLCALRPSEGLLRAARAAPLCTPTNAAASTENPSVPITHRQTNYGATPYHNPPPLKLRIDTRTKE